MGRQPLSLEIGSDGPTIKANSIVVHVHAFFLLLHSPLPTCLQQQKWRLLGCHRCRPSPFLPRLVSPTTSRCSSQVPPSFPTPIWLFQLALLGLSVIRVWLFWWKCIAISVAPHRSGTHLNACNVHVKYYRMAHCKLKKRMVNGSQPQKKNKVSRNQKARNKVTQIRGNERVMAPYLG